MTCQDVPELLSASLDGELTSDEQAQLDAHLNTCPACRALYEDLAGLHTADWEPEVPPELTERILANLPAQQTGKVIYWKRWGAMAAAIALVALAAWRLPLRPPADPGITADTSDTTGAVNMTQATDVTEAALSEDADEMPMVASVMDEVLPVGETVPPTSPEHTGEYRSAKKASTGGSGTQASVTGAQNSSADAPAQAPELQPVPTPVDDAPMALFSAPLPDPDPDVVLGSSQDSGAESGLGMVGAAFAPTTRAAMVPVEEAASIEENEVPESLPPMPEEELAIAAEPFEDLAEDVRDFSSYRWVLTLSQADGLECYPHQLQDGGEMWYLLPLEAVEALPQTLAETDPCYALRDTGDDLTTDSPYVLVVVPPAP